ncbi:hypothetical protein [Nostoc sp. 'Peltigera malacea cyanobiont' DB3992]|uniref:hypothetical protein n=1 Tax=Nostoc sp. 'Peltigera malacea cyanobiont' DB3992 TaxID=1206980 RepID=UPI0015D4D1F0|nr:hypothetical protein [Nostoc sp. 'Peltigera malacea cyanobiont' DB3992]
MIELGTGDWQDLNGIQTQPIKNFFPSPQSPVPSPQSPSPQSPVPSTQYPVPSNQSPVPLSCLAN